MAKHEFGIMQKTPEKGERFDEYEPQKYNCVSIDDDVLTKVVERLFDADFYWHTVDVPAKGLAYNGITLIPPTSMQGFINAVERIPELSELNDLIKAALAQNKWIIHFGI